MRTASFALAASLAAAVAGVACHSAPPPPPPPPRALSDSAAAALRWVESHAVRFAPGDSVASAEERAGLFALTAGARIIGFSELTEGTHEFPYVVRRALFALADSGVRGLAIQTSMADAMEVNRYVHSGSGDVRRMLHTLASWRWETREMIALVEAMREWNAAHPDRQVGFYGFEIPSASHAVSVINNLPASVIGAPLKAWLAQRYSCVAMNEGAHWGLEGRASDSTFWASCGPATVEAADSIAAVRRRIGATSPAASDLAFAEDMARLVQHHVSVGLRHLTRHDANAEHVLFLADRMGTNGRLLLWGGDVEMGRLTLDATTVQTAVPLGKRLGAAYRNIAFAFGDGIVRARVASGNARGTGGGGLSNAPVAAPLPDTYEDVLTRAGPNAYWLDFRSLATDAGNAWLKGPRSMRLITELYAPQAPQLFQTPINVPGYFDALVFINHVTAAHQ